MCRIRGLKVTTSQILGVPSAPPPKLLVLTTFLHYRVLVLLVIDEVGRVARQISDGARASRTEGQNGGTHLR